MRPLDLHQLRAAGVLEDEVPGPFGRCASHKWEPTCSAAGSSALAVIEHAGMVGAQARPRPMRCRFLSIDPGSTVKCTCPSSSTATILLVAGDKAGNWNKWYGRMIPRAEHLYEIYLKERAAEEGNQ
jgi:hypothetical protein